MEQIDHVFGNGKASLLAPKRMVSRFLIDPSVRGDDAAEWEGIMAFMLLLEGSTGEAERQAQRNSTHWISASVLKLAKSKKPADKQTIMSAWNEASAKLKSGFQSIEDGPIVRLKKRREEGSQILA